MAPFARARSAPVATAQERLIARLETIARLSDRDRQAIRTLPFTVREVAAGRDIVHEGERTAESCVVIDGFLQRYKMLPSGRRQILAFHIAGDVPDLQSLHLPLMDHSLGAVSDSRVATVAHVALTQLIAENESVAHALWREALIDAARFREWIANLGGRPGLPRVAHLLCELYVRARAVGVAQGESFAMPLTQTQVGEALGMSAVHVNRMVAELKRRRLIEPENRRMRILDLDGLIETAEFDPAYLHMRAGG